MGNDWNSFMQSKNVRVFLYSVCTACCIFYSVGAIQDLVSPSETNQMLIENMGQTGFIVMTVVRLLVCLWAAFAFGRLALSTFKSKEDE